MPLPLSHEQLVALLKDEYLFVQKSLEDFDVRSITIKAWSITFSLAAIAGGFASKEPLAFLIASASSLVFWFLETHWKCFQDAHHERSRTIEAFFRGEMDEIAPMQVGHTWYKRFHAHSKYKMWTMAWWPHVMLPHAVVMVLGIVLYLARA